MSGGRPGGVQTAELLLDAATEAAVLAQWRVLDEAGLPSQAHNTGATNRPHVTVAVAGAMPEEVDADLAGAAADLPLPVLLGPLVVLGGRRHVLARLLVPSPALLSLHAAAARAVAACPDRSELVAPGAWTPHVTLARGLSADDVAAALGVLGTVRSDPAQVVGLRRFDGGTRTTWLLAGADEHGDAPPG